MKYCLFTVLLLVAVVTRAAITVDGKLNEPEWQSATHLQQFGMVEPASNEAPKWQTDVFILPQPEGLYVAFRNEQPDNEVLRTRTHKPRDARPMSSDINYFLVDFNGDGEIAYEFTVNLANTQRDGVITQENQFNSDWDGYWDSAVSEDEHYWYSEIRIPWSIAPMRNSDAPERDIAVNAGRFIWSQQWRMAQPALALDKPLLVSQFQKVHIAQFQQSEWHIVPYIASSYDFVPDKAENNAGIDVFWKPNGDHQFALTLNPDFGQVESDELVVNFSAIETFYSDKRPFFTENQSVFDLQTPDEGRLLHTRRIGDARDDGALGASDIDFGLKANGTVEQFTYGLLLSGEKDRDDIGRTFSALRWRYPGKDAGLGYLFTRVEHPYNDRTADVHSADFDWHFAQDWSFDGQFIRSIVTQNDQIQTGSGAWWRFKQQPNGPFNQSLALSHSNKNLDYNDFGYQPRSDIQFAHYIAEYRAADFGDTSALQSGMWRFAIKPQRNSAHTNLAGWFNVWQEYRFNDTKYYLVEWWQQWAGYDDLLTQGHNLAYLKPRTNIWQGFGGQQDGDFRQEVALWWHEEGVSESAVQLEWRPSYVVSDALTIAADLRYAKSPDWLIWRDAEQVLGRYRRDMASVSVNANWVGVDQELRVKFQWLGLTAEARESLSADVDGQLHVAATTIPDFDINNLGLQIRYRYLLGPLSDLYVVYSKGGFAYDEREARDNALSLWQEGLQLRDADQVFVKLRYRL